jgi:2-polyprenyl-3-methyl-5-hydroxy-6-metoxy-1,4-benzoquinol methylase
MENRGKRDFDAVADAWDEEPRRVQLAQEIATAICRELPLATEMQALDYGCGSGLVTLGLQPFVGRITGADSSQGMLQVLSRKLRERGITNVDTKFIDPEQQQLAGGYDLVVSSMTLHHVDDAAALIDSLVQMLNPGGWLAVADLESEDGSFHDDPTGVYHRGFDRAFFSSVCSKNALTDIRIITAATIDKSKGSDGSRLYPVLLCLARKPA